MLRGETVWARWAAGRHGLRLGYMVHHPKSRLFLTPKKIQFAFLLGENSVLVAESDSGALHETDSTSMWP